MEHLINQNLTTIQISGIRQFFNMVSQYDDVVSLTIGQPDFSTPTHVKEAAIAAIQADKTSYTHNAGIWELRSAISSFVNERYQLHYHPDNEIIVTVGASQAIDVSLRTIIQPGDEVVLPGPVYPGYEPLIKLAGATPKYVDTRHNGFKFTANLIKQALTSKTKAIILPYPSNPTGVTLTSSELKEIADLVENKELFVIADEIYSELVYNQPHTSIGTFKEIRDQVIVINGVSKSHAMTGFRIGYILAPAWLSGHMLKVHQYNVSCATSISQYAALEAIRNGRKDPEIMKEDYDQRRAYVLQRLKEMDLDYVTPDGAFYVFPRLTTKDKSSFNYAVEILEKSGLALVPGDAFSKYGDGYMRLSYAYSMDTLKEALNRLEKFLTS
ncbi:aminotransferase A [Halobacillus salinarum]|uniref:Aminotransferase n=1 Tax=Halobacillus salinarum TaxID=2932257 RepID=A0ABY4EGW0_9BACI|nr:aminotransferase A [Halobacillus salinarum]UOQ43235.1 aminotransferase A [Halobacillus salinarum]